MPTIHASAVAIAGRALLIRGPSGSGKSSLALELMALGAGLIADDRVVLDPRDGMVLAGCPRALTGRIEARGVGILAATPAPSAAVALVVDLGRAETRRLPPNRHTLLCGICLPLVLGPLRPHLAAALRQTLLGGRLD